MLCSVESSMIDPTPPSENIDSPSVNFLQGWSMSRTCQVAQTFKLILDLLLNYSHKKLWISSSQKGALARQVSIVSILYFISNCTEENSVISQQSIGHPVIAIWRTKNLCLCWGKCTAACIITDQPADLTTVHQIKRRNFLIIISSWQYFYIVQPLMQTQSLV